MQRSFLDLSETDIADIEKAAFFARDDFRGAVRWDDLLKSRRVLIVSEAGAGKTYECQEQQKRLWNTMMAMWRKGRPTLRSERRPEAKDRFLVKWQFGLAAIYAEAEDPAWAKKLSESEARLACRYAPLELNSFPSWLGGLAAEHPTAVDRTLGQELTLSLQEEEDNTYSLFLQNVRHASPTVAAVFVPRIRQWLNEVAKVNAEPNEKGLEQNLRQAVEILGKFGNGGDRDYLAATATERLKGGLGVPFASVWLPTLLRLRPGAGVEVLEKGKHYFPVERRSPMVCAAF